MQSLMGISESHTAPCHIGELYIYPIKSLGGVALPQAMVLPKGLQYDRRWMLVDEHGRFITQREHHSLALARVSVGASALTVQVGHRQVAVPFEAAGVAMQATVWNDEVTVQEVDAAISGQLSDMLGIACRLVYFPEEAARPVDADYALSQNDQTSLSDGYPILVISQSSLHDLNKRLPEVIDMRRFRPNVVVYGGHAYQEDHWARFSAGQVAMAGVKPCARCVLTTINPDTGIAGKEPLHTLSGYRRQGSKVLFGQNVIPLQSGIISVGDAITLLP